MEAWLVSTGSLSLAASQTPELKSGSWASYPGSSMLVSGARNGRTAPSSLQSAVPQSTWSTSVPSHRKGPQEWKARAGPISQLRTTRCLGWFSWKTPASQPSNTVRPSAFQMHEHTTYTGEPRPGLRAVFQRARGQQHGLARHELLTSPQ